MHGEVEGPERFAAFWRSPDDGQAGERDQAVDEIAGRRADLDLIERDELISGDTPSMRSTACRELKFTDRALFALRRASPVQSTSLAFHQFSNAVIDLC
jgi:hypothetical protein